MWQHIGTWSLKFHSQLIRHKLETSIYPFRSVKVYMWCFLFTVVLSRLSGGQVPSKDTASARIAAAIREKRSDYGVLAASLAQADGQRSAAALNSIADSLVAIVLSNTTTLSAEAKKHVVLALALASTWGTTENPQKRGVPFVGALPALSRIAENGDKLLRWQAIRSIGQLPDAVAATRTLVQIAESQNPAAFVAVDALAHVKGTPAGLVTLRQLWERGTITQRLARQLVEEYAGMQGWRQASAAAKSLSRRDSVITH